MVLFRQFRIRGLLRIQGNLRLLPFLRGPYADKSVSPDICPESRYILGNGAPLKIRASAPY